MISIAVRLLPGDIEKTPTKPVNITFDILLIVLGIMLLISSHHRSRVDGTRGVIAPEDLPQVVLRVVVQGSTLNGQNVVNLEDEAKGYLYCVKTPYVLPPNLTYVKKWRENSRLEWTIVPASRRRSTSIDDVNISE